MPVTQEDPKARSIVGRYLADAAGRHKVYTALVHPLKCRVAYWAGQAKVPVPEVQMLPEETFWPMVERVAQTKGQPLLDTLFELADTIPRPTRKPAHPFLVG